MSIIPQSCLSPSICILSRELNNGEEEKRQPVRI